MAVGTNSQNTGRSKNNCRSHPDGVRCPFCGSSDTKFKFLNNKKVDQPRYQCSNCKKYWTQGGRIRGVYTGTEGVRNPVAGDTTSQPSASATASEPSSEPTVSATTSEPSWEPSVSAVSTPTPTASEGPSLGGVDASASDSLWNALVEVTKRFEERDFPDLEQRNR